ncbi:MAG: hypothetical protein LBK62_03885 [Treponema sp.]|jgi:hypothetical protein|nr:hypothetical protein [Treponema sp.]
MYVGGTLTMSGGTISGNSAFNSGYGGGGVGVWTGTFRKTGGGTVYGNEIGAPNWNQAAGNKGHAVWKSSGNRSRNTTAGPADNIDSTNNTGL